MGRIWTGSKFDEDRAMSSLAAGFLSGQSYISSLLPLTVLEGKWKKLSMQHRHFKHGEPTYTKKTEDKRVTRGMMALRRQQQVDPGELEVTLVYRANFRPVTGTQ